MKRIIHSIIPAVLLALSVGQIYAFTNFASPIAEELGANQASVQFAFSLGIFFLGMGAAFFGNIVEENIKLASSVGTGLFILGLLFSSLAVCSTSLILLYIGYGVLLGLGTGIIYIVPVKTMMLWYPNNKALAAAVPIVSFGLGATLSTFIFHIMGDLSICHKLLTFVVLYLPIMVIGICLLKKPLSFANVSVANSYSSFKYKDLLHDIYFIRAWLFMLINISCGLMLIPLAKQMMVVKDVDYSVGTVAWIVGMCGVFNGGGRLLFAWISDRVMNRIDSLFIISISSIVVLIGNFDCPQVIGFSLLMINAFYGAGFAVIPGILAEHYGMENISKIHGAVLSAWGIAGLIGNQVAILIENLFGAQYSVIILLCILYAYNVINSLRIKKIHKIPQNIV
jgi:OFA family oxalate/formate antiporter-like MFS transporter